MIDWLHLCGFKSFADQRLSLGRLTVLSGLNNSGKSSLIQALRMITATHGVKGPYLPGLGGYAELKSNFSALSEPLSISVGVSGVEYQLHLQEGGGYRCTDGFNGPLTQFLSADRHGPMVELPMLIESHSPVSVGERGEYSAHFASILEGALIRKSIQHPASTSETLKHQLIAWMNEISPGVKLDFQIQRGFDASRMAVDGYRATNSGFGISYVLPVLLSLLAMTARDGADKSDARAFNWYKSLSSRGGLLLIENPEAHLHPKGQTAIGRLLVAAAAEGLQIVVETHSDHVLDGIRLGMRASETMEAGDTRVYYFTRPYDGSTQVAEIHMEKSGRLSAWPEGFFDQMSKNLKELSSAPQRK